MDSATPLISALAGASRSSVTIVTSTSRRDQQGEKALISAFEADGISTETEHSEDNVTEHIRSLQGDKPGSWIVVGSKMRSGFRRSIFGSVADRLARDATGPMIVVPDKDVRERRLKDARKATRELAQSL